MVLYNVSPSKHMGIYIYIFLFLSSLYRHQWLSRVSVAWSNALLPWRYRTQHKDTEFILLFSFLQQCTRARTKYNWIACFRMWRILPMEIPTRITDSLWQTVEESKRFPSTCRMWRQTVKRNQTTNICPPVQLPHISSKFPRNPEWSNLSCSHSDLFNNYRCQKLQTTCWEKCTFSSAVEYFDKRYT